MKKWMNIIFVCALIANTNAQVGGISASKLATICTNPVAPNTIEFEPAFSFSNATKYFDDTKNVRDIFPGKDSVVSEAALGFRMSYGAFEGMELGMFIDNNGESLSLGAKYMFMVNEKTSFAALMGYNKVLNAALPTENISYEFSDLMAAGLASTLQFNDVFSLDMDVQGQKAIRETTDNHNLDFFMNADLGYYVFDWLQPVIGFNYSKGYFNIPRPLLTPDAVASSVLNLGFTIEPAEQFLMVINTPITLAGKSVDKSYGLGFALTVTLE